MAVTSLRGWSVPLGSGAVGSQWVPTDILLPGSVLWLDLPWHLLWLQPHLSRSPQGTLRNWTYYSCPKWYLGSPRGTQQGCGEGRVWSWDSDFIRMRVECLGFCGVHPSLTNLNQEWALGHGRGKWGQSSSHLCRLPRLSETGNFTCGGQPNVSPGGLASSCVIQLAVWLFGTEVFWNVCISSPKLNVKPLYCNPQTYYWALTVQGKQRTMKITSFPQQSLCSRYHRIIRNSQP